jgi:WD40 repeat protein
MGVVYMAEQEQPVRRQVALKIIKLGMDSAHVVARFEAERQALALMDHTNIAKVFDAAATDTGRPYFVMELVNGVPITRFCDDNNLSVRERLELFVPVCQAIQHAHQKGIIHRDVKPSNVLVTLYDGRPVPKVIDFGIAKATEQRLTERTLFTQYGQIVGTFEYMSPEQAELSGLDIDTRSDVYSLGVLLYELLTGGTPLTHKRLREASYTELLRLIREEEAEKPSTRLSHSGEALASIAVQRKSEPAKLSRLVRGELDWIVLKALEKDRTRRYESASSFAVDVQHYLNDEAVQACPPSAWYRFGKLARRHKGAALTAAAVAVALLLAVGSLVSAVLVLAASNAQVTKEQKQTQEALKREQETSYARGIALAERQLSAGNVGRAEELLDKCPEQLRGWEWHLLKRQRYGNPVSLVHPETAVRVAFSRDGEIASVCMDGKVRLWEARTGKELPNNLQGLASPNPGQLVHVPGSLVYSPEGLYLAGVPGDGTTVCVWKRATGELLCTLRGHEKKVEEIAFSPDGHTLASASQDQSVRLWDIGAKPANEADRLIRILAKHPAEVVEVAFSPDGGHLLAACKDGTVKTWDLATEQETFSFRAEFKYGSRARFSPDTRRLGWACHDGVVQVWDTATGNLELALQTNTYWSRGLAFSPDASRIAVAGFDGTVRLLDGSTGGEILTIYAHHGPVINVTFSPDGYQLASASYDHTIRLWDATPLTSDPQAAHSVTLTGDKQQVSGIAFSPDGRWLASAVCDSTVKVWKVEGLGDAGASAPSALTLRYTLRGHRGDVIAVAFSSDNRTLASASWDNTVKLWNLPPPERESPTEPRTIDRGSQRVQSIAFSPDGQLLAIGLDKGIAIYDPVTVKEVHPFKRTPVSVPGLAFSPDGRRLYSAGASDPTVKVWEVAGEEPIITKKHSTNPNATVAVSPDGRLFASAGRDKTNAPVVKIWDAQTGEDLHTLKGHVGFVWRVAFSPDGRYLASGSWDSTIKVWDLKALESAEPVTLRGHAGFIRSLAFSPDSRRLASASGHEGHGEIKLWDATLWQNKTNGGR